MKHLFIVALIACFSSSAFAQESLISRDSVFKKMTGNAQTMSGPQQNTKQVICMCCGVPSQLQPMYIVKVHQKNFVLDPLTNVNPDGIEKINVLKDAAAIKEYGEAAKYGAIIITLKDDKYSENLDEFRGHIKKIES